MAQRRLSRYWCAIWKERETGSGTVKRVALKMEVLIEGRSSLWMMFGKGLFKMSAPDQSKRGTYIKRTFAACGGGSSVGASGRVLSFSGGDGGVFGKNGI